jgi:hypothetical protein
MMEGFGVHTFRLINKEGKSTFVKFHFRPRLGVHSLVWDEALKLAGQGELAGGVVILVRADGVEKSSKRTDMGFLMTPPPRSRLPPT